MTIPTPSDFAKLQTQRKQQETEREKLIESVEEKLERAERKKHSSTVAQNRKRSSAHGSKASPSSRRGKASATSSKSEQNDSSTTPKSSSTTQSTTQKPQEPGTEPIKKPFKRQPHLTQRLSDNETLKELRNSMPQVKHANRRSSSKFTKSKTSSRKRTEPPTGSTSKKK